MERTPLVQADDRRVTNVLAHGAAVVLEAPAGFGKTHLLHHLHDRLGGAELITSGERLTTLAGHPNEIDATALLVDVEDPDPQAIEALAGIVDVEMLVIAGRVVGREVRDIMGRYDCLELSTVDFALTDTEIASLLDTSGRPLDQATVELIRAQTAGWPAAVIALAGHVKASRASLLDDPALLRRGLAHHPVIDRLSRDTIARLPGALAHGLARFGLLERFTAAAFDAVTEHGAVRDLVRAGIPVLEDVDGWLHLPPVLRAQLGDDITPADAECIAPHLAQSGGLLPAAQALVASGSLHAAARLVRDARRSHLDDIDARALLGLLDAIAPVDTGELELVRARAHETLGERQEAAAVVDRLVAEVDTAQPVWTDARLEQLRLAALNGASGPSPDEENLDLVTPEQFTRAREVIGLQAAQSSDPAVVEQSIGLLEAAAGEWQALSDPSRAAVVLRSQAAIAAVHLGRYPEAIDAAERARRLGWHRLFDRALSTVLLLRLGGQAGRPDLIEREAAAAESLAESVQMPWLEHHIAAATAHGCVFTDRPDGAVAWAQRAEHMLGALRDHSTATLFHAEMAVALTTAGRADAAAHHLDAARSRRDDNPVEVAIAEATVAAQAGDVQAAQRLIDELEADPTVPATRLWRPQLALAIAANDPDGADAARAMAQMLGLGDLADRLGATADTAVSVRVLGGFEVTCCGQALPALTGKPAELLKLLVCRDGTVTVDQAIDALWDDAPSTDVGVRRLKNPINRLREAVGADAIIRSSAAIHLGPGVDTDLARFTTAALRATGVGGGREASVAAVEALNLFEPLLPDEPPSELVANRSVDLVATASGLFDLVLRQPEDRPSSAWLLDTARRIDLYAEPWFTAIARMAIDENSLVHARQALALAKASAVELDLPDNPEVEAMTALLNA